MTSRTDYSQYEKLAIFLKDNSRACMYFKKHKILNICMGKYMIIKGYLFLK